MKPGTKVRVLRGTWAGKEGEIMPLKPSHFKEVMDLYSGVQVKIEGKVYQLLENNLEII